MTELDTLRDRAEALHLHGLVSHWPEVADRSLGRAAARVGGDAARLPQPASVG